MAAPAPPLGSGVGGAGAGAGGKGTAVGGGAGVRSVWRRRTLASSARLMGSLLTVLHQLQAAEGTEEVILWDEREVDQRDPHQVRGGWRP